MDILKSIRKKLGHCDFEWVPTQWLDTGIPDLNEVMGDRNLGIPFGRIFEISGLESAGKTSVFMAMAALAQYSGAFVIWLDFENSFISKWGIQRGLAACPSCKGEGRVSQTKKTKINGKMTEVEILAGCKDCGGGGVCKTCNGSAVFKGKPCSECLASGEAKGIGMDTNRFVLIQPYVGEFARKGKDKEGKPLKGVEVRLSNAEELCAEAEMVMEEIHKNFEKVFLAVDSIPSMMTEGEDDAGIKGGNLRTEQELPKFLNKLMRRWVGRGQVYNCMIMMINQLRQNPMARFGDPWYTPGGNAVRFYSHVRVRVSRIKGGKIMDGGDQVGIQGIMKNKKNKVGGVEQRTVGYRIIFKGSVEFLPASKIKAAIKEGGGDASEE